MESERLGVEAEQNYMEMKVLKCNTLDTVGKENKKRKLEEERKDAKAEHKEDYEVGVLQQRQTSQEYHNKKRHIETDLDIEGYENNGFSITPMCPISNLFETYHRKMAK